MTIDPSPERLVVDVVDLGDGHVRRRLVDAALPPAWHHGVWIVSVDGLDATGDTGYLALRARFPSPAWGFRYGSVLATGDGLRFLDETPVGPSDDPPFPDPAARSPARGFAPDRVFMGATFPDHGRSRLETPEGTLLWERDGRTRLAGRSGDLSVVSTASEVQGIADDGTTRWRRPGRLLVAPPGLAWVSHRGRVLVVEVSSGTVLRTSRVPWPGDPVLDSPDRRVGLHPDDGVVLVERDERLWAYGWR